MPRPAQQHTPIWRRPALVFGILGGIAIVAVLLAQTGLPPAAPAAPGQPFPALTDLSAVGPDGELVDFDLAATGKDNYLLIFYWVAGHGISEDNLVAMQNWVHAHEKVSLVSVVPPRGKTAKQVRERATALGVDVPIIWDDGYRVQRTVRASQVPHITLLDPGRTVRVSGAASPHHTISPGTTFADYLTRAIAGKGSPTITRVPRYYPVTELVNGPFPDFVLDEVPSHKSLRFSDRVTDGKLTLLVFWSPDCGHCKKELPLLNDYFKSHRSALNIVGIVKMRDAGFRQRTSDFIRANDLQFPTVSDETEDTWDAYKVVTTPTTVVVTPDGKIDTVLLGSGVDLDKELTPRIGRLAPAGDPGA
ncbi:MAG: TlpA family protein disulfide reductase [Acidobacteriota bacterium]